MMPRRHGDTRFDGMIRSVDTGQLVQDGTGPTLRGHSMAWGDHTMTIACRSEAHKLEKKYKYTGPDTTQQHTTQPRARARCPDKTPHEAAITTYDYPSDTIRADSPQGTRGPASHSWWGLNLEFLFWDLFVLIEFQCGFFEVLLLRQSCSDRLNFDF